MAQPRPNAPARAFGLRAHRGSSAALLAFASCAAPAPSTKVAPAAVPPPTASGTAQASPPKLPEPDAGASSIAAEPAPVPVGAAALAIHVEPGKRQPIEWIGNIENIRPPQGSTGLDAWHEVTLSGSGGPPARFYLQYSPAALVLPFAQGDRVRVEIDCRKGGWHRVCDGAVMDVTKNPLLIVSASGNDDLAKDWKVERGPVATSETRKISERTIQHTYGLTFTHQGAKVVALAHEWTQLLARGRSYLVSGYEVVWEGVPPPDARNHRAFAVVRRRD